MTYDNIIMSECQLQYQNKTSAETLEQNQQTTKKKRQPYNFISYSLFSK